MSTVRADTPDASDPAALPPPEAPVSSAAPGGPRRARTPERRQRRWAPLAAGWLALVIGLADIASVAIPSLHLHTRLHRINTFVPGPFANVTRTADVIIGLMLLLLAHGLRRRKRRAWQAVTLLLAFSAAIHLAHYPHWAPACVAVAALAALVFYRREFYAMGDPRTRWRALAVLAGLVVADVAIGLTYILLARGLAANYSLWQRCVHVVYGLVGVSGPVQFVPEGRSDLFNLLTSALGVFTLVVAAYLFLRPAEPPGRLSEADRRRVRDLLARHGERDSLGYFTLRDDKSVIWSPSGKSCVGYRVVSGVMLAGGDPLGDPEAWPGAIHAFLDEADRHAWVPAVMGCGEQAAEAWCREGGLTALELGDEAVVETAGFTLKGRAMRNVRQMVARVARQGYVAQVRRAADIPPAELAELVRQADSWRGSQTERGFSMALGRVGGRGDDSCVIVTATQDGALRAMLHFVPWGADGLSLDLMRRDRGAQPGVNDFLIVEAIKAAREQGVRRVSLNFAVFRSALERGERIGAGPVLRAWRGLLVFASRWFQIESLYKFNAKFCPAWSPRFFVFPGTKNAPRVAVAALEAEAFLTWPRLEVRRLARRLARRLGARRMARLLGGRRDRRVARRRAGRASGALARPRPAAAETRAAARIPRRR